MCVCVTCPYIYPTIGVGCIQAGHFIDGRNNAVLFEEEAIHGQCYSCNVGKHGNKLEYWKFMETTYGREFIDELMIKSHQVVKYQAWDYDQIAEKYAKMTELLKGNL